MRSCNQEIWSLIFFLAFDLQHHSQFVIFACPNDYCSCSDTEGIINCSNRKLEKVPEFKWEPDTEKYKELDLARNDIISVPPFAFRHLRVKSILLDRNPLIGVSPRAFDGIEADLTILELSNTKLEVIHWGVFRHLRNLTHLGLVRNDMFAIPKGLFDGLTSLKELSLSFNMLSTLSGDMFRNLEYLEQLHFQGNRIYSIEPGAFADSRHLRLLNLKSNHISSLDYSSVKELGRLETLSLENNLLTSVPKSIFNHLPSLLQVFMGENHITEVSSRSFTGAPLLQEVNLSDNKITSVAHDAFLGTNLTVLHLERNAIKSLGDGQCQLNNIDSLKKLYLDGNPIVCDCRAMWLQHLVNKGVQVTGTCDGPKANRNKPISNMVLSGCDTFQCSSQ